MKEKAQHFVLVCPAKSNCVYYTYAMTATKLIDNHIATLPEWQAKVITTLRNLIHTVDPDVTEEWKWSTPIFSHNGMICALGNFSDHVKINFFQGASLNDPEGLFNAGLEAKKTRAIDIFEHDTLNLNEIEELIRSAVALNTAKK